VAQDLHDTLGQTLAAMKFGIEHALELLPKKTAQRSKASLEAVVPVAKNAIEEVRRIQKNLRRPSWMIWVSSPPSPGFAANFRVSTL